MMYRITHTTSYQYSQAVGLCQNEARLQPRDFWRQKRISNRFEISPPPMDFREQLDFFGNCVAYFAIEEPHTHLTVTVVSDVAVFPKPYTPDLFNPLSWEQVRDLLWEPSNLPSSQSPRLDDNQTLATEIYDARQYLLDSPMIITGNDLYRYAEASFLPNRPLVDVVQDLMRRIHQDFIYDPTFTTIATPLSDVLMHRRGVCQDFAHLAIGCLRSYGLAARYVSGYVETQPAEGEKRLTGGDASHAWFAVYVPGSGWLEFDPTNNKLPLDQHITLAWGRDYADVTPLKGIAFGGGHHNLSVSVDVKRLATMANDCQE